MRRYLVRVGVRLPGITAEVNDLLPMRKPAIVLPLAPFSTSTSCINSRSKYVYLINSFDRVVTLYATVGRHPIYMQAHCCYLLRSLFIPAIFAGTRIRIDRANNCWESNFHGQFSHNASLNRRGWYGVACRRLSFQWHRHGDRNWARYCNLTLYERSQQIRRQRLCAFFKRLFIEGNRKLISGSASLLFIIFNFTVDQSSCKLFLRLSYRRTFYPNKTDCINFNNNANAICTMLILNNAWEVNILNEINTNHCIFFYTR